VKRFAVLGEIIPQRSLKRNLLGDKFACSVIHEMLHEAISAG
jgi:hypothetical protein